MSRLDTDACGAITQSMTPTKMQPVVSISATHAVSAAVTESFIELWSSVDCFYSVGTAPVATTTPRVNNIRLRAEVARIIMVAPGSKVSFVTESSTGTAEIVEY